MASRKRVTEDGDNKMLNEVSKKTILWMSENFPPSTGGVQLYLYNTIINLKEYNSIVICNGRVDQSTKCIDEEFRLKGHKIYRSDYIPHNIGTKSLFKFLKIIKSYFYMIQLALKHDISLFAIGHGTVFNLVLLYLMSLSLKLPVATVLHGEDIPDPGIKFKSYSFVRWLLGKADIHICNSTFTYRRLKKFCGQINKSFVAYPGVEDRFFEIVDTSELCSKYNAENKKIILTVGRLDARKGHDLVIDALPRIINIFPDVQYLIGGTGPHLGSLKQKVADLHLQDYVIFCGFIPDQQIVAFHQLANIFVMPNRVLDDGDTEGFGIVFLEASAGGKPVIGGSCGGALDAIEDGRSGYLVNPYNPDELSEKIIYLLSNPNEAEKMGNYGRQRAMDFFRWPYLSAKFEKFLNEAI